MICTVIEVWEWITMYHQYNMFTHSMHATGKQGSWCKPVNKTNWHQVPRVSTSYLDMCSYQVISVLNPLLLSVCVRKLAYEAKQQHWTCYETQLFRCVPFISFVWNWSTEKWLMHWVNLEKKSWGNITGCKSSQYLALFASFIFPTHPVSRSLMKTKSHPKLHNLANSVYLHV